jgi:hypothetical protein
MNGVLYLILLVILLRIRSDYNGRAGEERSSGQLKGVSTAAVEGMSVRTSKEYPI